MFGRSVGAAGDAKGGVSVSVWTGHVGVREPAGWASWRLDACAAVVYHHVTEAEWAF